MLMNDLKKSDSEVFDLIVAEGDRIERGVELIPSENFVSKAVMQAMSSVFTLGGLPWETILRGPGVRRQGGAPRHQEGQGALRRRARERAAVLGVTRKSRRLLRSPGAR